MSLPHFVLIHAPLVGPLTWSLVADLLREQGCAVTLPRLHSVASDDRPYWQQHVAQVIGALRGAFAQQTTPMDAPLVLVAHSGAGPLLPSVQQAIPRPVTAVILVDALFPEDGKSRLDLFESQSAADEFRAAAVNGLLPAWTETDLRGVITNDALRRAVAEELRPLPLAVYEETIPVFAGWPGVSAAYLRFGDTPAYDRSFWLAEASGWLVERWDGQHFEMIEHPRRVAQALIDLLHRLGITMDKDRLDA